MRLTNKNEPASKIFESASLALIEQHSKLTGAELEQLAERFERIGQNFRRILFAVPNNLKLGPDDRGSVKRQERLGDAILNPTAQLLEALDEPALLACWPDVIPAMLSDKETSEIKYLLGRLRNYALELVESLADRSADKSTINAELRFDLVSQLADACRKVGMPVNRDYHSGIGNMTTAAQTIAAACKIISGTTFSIDHHLKDYLKLR